MEIRVCSPAPLRTETAQNPAITAIWKMSFDTSGFSFLYTIRDHRLGAFLDIYDQWLPVRVL